jgi:hypothetical protein
MNYSPLLSKKNILSPSFYFIKRTIIILLGKELFTITAELQNTPYGREK